MKRGRTSLAVQLGLTNVSIANDALAKVGRFANPLALFI